MLSKAAGGAITQKNDIKFSARNRTIYGDFSPSVTPATKRSGLVKVTKHRVQGYYRDLLRSRLTNVFRLVERFGDLPCEDRVNRAYDDEDDRVEERNHVAGIDVRVAHEQIILSGRIMVDRVCRVYNYPNAVNQKLGGWETGRSVQLDFSCVERFSYNAL